MTTWKGKWNLLLLWWHLNEYECVQPPDCRLLMCLWRWPRWTTLCKSCAGSTERLDGNQRVSRGCGRICWTPRTLLSSSQQWCLWWWWSCGHCCGSSYVSESSLVLEAQKFNSLISLKNKITIQFLSSHFMSCSFFICFYKLLIIKIAYTILFIYIICNSISSDGYVVVDVYLHYCETVV